MFRDAALVARKDLKIELRSRVALSQIAPFAFSIIILFGFALDPDRGTLSRAAPGLFWVAVILSAILAVQRSLAVEVQDGSFVGLRMSGLDPAGVFLGKAAAIAAQLVVLEVLLGVGVVVFYGVVPSASALLVAVCFLAAFGVAAAGTLYGAFTAGGRGRETLLPMLFLPVVAPVLLAAARATELAIANSASQGWIWAQILTVFAVVYVAVGVVAFGPLLEDA